jgi:hypothetical protein
MRSNLINTINYLAFRMSSRSDKNSEMKSNSSRKLLDERFTGAMDRFQVFYEGIKIQVAQEFGRDGLRHLFHNWPLMEDTEDTPNVGHEFTEKVLPPSLEGVRYTHAINADDGSSLIDAAMGLRTLTPVTETME